MIKFCSLESSQNIHYLQGEQKPVKNYRAVKKPDLKLRVDTDELTQCCFCLL